MSRKVDTKRSTLEKKTWGFLLFEERRTGGLSFFYRINSSID